MVSSIEAGGPQCDGPAAGIVTYSYGAQTTGALGLTTTITDQAAKKRMSVNDALGQLVDVWEQSDSAGTLGWETAYQYDTLGNLKRVDQKGGDASSANWRTRTFTYDSLSRLLTANNPESGQICYGMVSGGVCQNNGYDLDGNVIYKTDAKGTTINYNYDQLHRVATIGTGPTQHAKYYTNQLPANDPPVDYFFDQTSYNGLAIVEGVGKQTGMADATGNSAWTFDSEGRTKIENQTINISGLTPLGNPPTKSITYSYNLDGSLQTMTYPSGRTVNYAYSTIGRTGLVNDTGTGGATYLSWSPPGTAVCSSDNQKRYSVHGEELCLNHGNNIISYNGFNKRFQPSLLSAAGASGTALSLSYTFTDANSKNNGLLWKITNNKDNTRSQNFTYDQLNRLTSGYTDGSNWGATYSPDPWGNTQAAQMAGKNGGEIFAHAFNGQNRIADWAGDYDANGNLTNDHAFSPHFFTYDAENRPYSGGGVTYYYDGTGERVAKKTATNTGKLYWFQDDNSPVAESDAAGTLSFEFIFANGHRLARRDSSGTVHYYFSDQINSANVITSADGSAIQSESDYMPYGGEIVIVADTTGNQYKFTGKERDIETDLDYFGARYYAHSFMRFMTPDWSATPVPIPYAQMGIPQTLNLYSYVENNPITGTDPDGHADPPKCIGDANCAYHDAIENAGKDKKEKKTEYSGQFFGKALAFLNSAKSATASAVQSAGSAIGKWIGMEYAVGLQQEKAEATARAKMTAQDYVHEWMFAMMLGKAAEAKPAAARTGEFSIIDWGGYPSEMPKPAGPFRLIDGLEYSEGRQAANATNSAIHKANPEIGADHIHEIHPVKFGGSPTDPANKMVLTPQQHSVVTTWWDRLRRALTK